MERNNQITFLKHGYTGMFIIHNTMLSSFLSSIRTKSVSAGSVSCRLAVGANLTTDL